MEILNAAPDTTGGAAIAEAPARQSADLLVPPKAPLGEGYRVEARIVTWESASVLKVPLSALFRHGSGWAVFVGDAGRARLRPVLLTHRGESEAEVLSGLRGGEAVIVYPSDEITDGVRVRDG